MSKGISTEILRLFNRNVKNIQYKKKKWTKKIVKI